MQVAFVRYKPDKLLFIEEEIMQSLTNAGSKATVSMAFKRYKKEATSYRELYFTVLRQIKAGKSSFTTQQELQEVFDRKEYYKTNQNIYGDYYENKIFNTDSG